MKWWRCWRRDCVESRFKERLEKKGFRSHVWRRKQYGG